MKIALLEWSCGGGLLDAATGHASQELCAEGWQMLKSLADGLADAGMDVVVPLASMADWQTAPRAALHTAARIVDLSHLAPANFSSALHCWAEIASECDYAWVIAPEIDGLLSRILHYLRRQGHLLLNCHGDFLRNGSDKRLTASALTAAGIPHPPTTRWAQVDEAWLAAAAVPGSSAGHSQTNPQWIIKPALGAGGAEQQMVTHAQLLHMRASSAAAPATPAADWLVQPWLSGQPASCTAIVDAHGQRHWLPLLSQDFESSHWLAAPGSSCPTSGLVGDGLASPTPHYVGCTYPCPALPAAAPRQLLEDTLDALGPGAYGAVGIDLLFHSLTHAWTVIEVNARCTTSLLAMTSAYRGNLVGDILQLLTSSSPTPAARFSSHLRPFQFRVAPVSPFAPRK